MRFLKHYAYVCGYKIINAEFQKALLKISVEIWERAEFSFEISNRCSPTY